MLLQPIIHPCLTLSRVISVLHDATLLDSKAAVQALLGIVLVCHPIAEMLQWVGRSRFPLHTLVLRLKHDPFGSTVCSSSAHAVPLLCAVHRGYVVQFTKYLISVEVIQTFVQSRVRGEACFTDRIDLLHDLIELLRYEPVVGMLGLVLFCRHECLISMLHVLDI